MPDFLWVLRTVLPVFGSTALKNKKKFLMLLFLKKYKQHSYSHPTHLTHRTSLMAPYPPFREAVWPSFAVPIVGMRFQTQHLIVLNVAAQGTLPQRNHRRHGAAPTLVSGVYLSSSFSYSLPTLVASHHRSTRPKSAEKALLGWQRLCAKIL